MNKKYIFVGTGPANIHCALELLKLGVLGANIVMFEKGKPVDKRHCPKSEVGKCANCPKCSVTAGFSGQGAFSDCKCSLNPEVGGDFPELIGYTETQQIIHRRRIIIGRAMAQSSSK